MIASLLKQHGTDFQNIFQYSENHSSVKDNNLKENEILVEVRCAGVNPADYKFAEGKVFFLRQSNFPLVIGKDGSGVVTKCGSKVSRFKPGDPVFGTLSGLKVGTFAQYCIFQETELAHIPKGMSFKEAASVAMAAQTAYQALMKHPVLAKFKRTHNSSQETSNDGLSNNGKSSGQMSSIDSILIQGASGGVGSLSVLLAKHYFQIKNIFTTCSSKNIEYVKRLGATHPIDYTSQKVEEVVPSILSSVKASNTNEGSITTTNTHNEDIQRGDDSKVDLCIDNICEEETAQPSMRVTKVKSGLYVAVAVPARAEDSIWNLFTTIGNSMWKSAYSYFFGGPRFVFFVSNENGEELEMIAQFLVQNKLHHLIPIKSYPLKDLPLALDQVRTHRTVGKIVIDIPPPKQ